jgi:xanthine dehydrogenase accessory factor
VVEWPTTWLARTPIDDRTVVCVLSHDARFDAEALAIVLATGAEYVGAMGSRTTHDRRVASLRERGVSDADIARLHSPIGLDLGASTPAETAVSILAEVLASRAGAGGQPLRETTGAIHRPAAATETAADKTVHADEAAPANETVHADEAAPANERVPA